jgi:hypoxanthine phosphoribosyltransferase
VFRVCAALTRPRTGRGGRTPSGIAVNVSSTDSTTADSNTAAANADPRLDGRAVKRVVYDAAAIQQRVRELGAAITAAYPDGDLLVLGLLKGSFIFLSDLVRHIERPLQVDFLVASSYGDAMESSGVVRLLYDPETELEGKHILLVEDIVDSGRTLSRLVDLLGERQPQSLEICALLHKHIATELQHPTRFVGFDAPHEFLVGYGLDHAENFRHLPYVASLQ